MYHFEVREGDDHWAFKLLGRFRLSAAARVLVVHLVLSLTRPPPQLHHHKLETRDLVLA